MSKRKTHVAALTLAACICASAAQAAVVTNWQLADFDNDGLMSDFLFFSPPTGNSSYKFGATGEMCGAIACAPIAMDGSTQGHQTFTMGFDYGGLGMMEPETYGGGILANIEANVLTFSQLNIGAMFSGVHLMFGADSLSAVDSSVTDLGNGNYGVVVRFSGVSKDPKATFSGIAANWRLEGVMTTVPEPSTYAMLLAGLGLVGFMARRKTFAPSKHQRI